VTRAAVLQWIGARSPAPPPALSDKLASIVTAAPDAVFAGGSVAEVAGRLGIATLRAVVRRQRVAHDGAMDLLAADAFVTYAFEAASEGEDDVTGLVRRLLAEVR
jgi:hypothetical protein